MYTPSSIITAIHSWPRFDASHGLARSDSTFNPAYQTDAGKVYIASVLSIAGIYFALGIVFFFAYIVVNLTCGCCCRASCCPLPKVLSKEEEARQRCRRWCCSARLWYMIPVAIMLAGAAAALSYVSVFKGAVDDFRSATKSFETILEIAGGNVTNIFVPSVTGPGGLTEKLNALLAAANANDPPYAPVVQGMLDGTSTLTSAALSFATMANSTASSLAGQINDKGSKIGSLDGHVTLGGYTSLGIFMGLFLISVAGLAANKCSKGFHYFCNAFLIVGLLLIFIFAGLFATVSIVGADVCVAPSAALTAVANIAGLNSGGTGNTDLVGTLTYYTTCGNGTADIAPSGAYASIANASSQFSPLALALADIQANAPPLAVEAAAVAVALSATNATLNSLIAGVSCAPIYSVFDQITTAFCNEAINSVIIIWGLASAACILIFLIVTSAARICCAHPADLAKRVEEAERNEARGLGNAYSVDNAAVGIALRPQNAPYANTYAPAQTTGSAVEYR